MSSALSRAVRHRPVRSAATSTEAQEIHLILGQIRELVEPWRTWTFWSDGTAARKGTVCVAGSGDAR